MRQVVKIALSCLAVGFIVPAAPAQVIDILHSFTGGPNDGQNPAGALLLSGSTLYGMTNRGGTANEGTIFGIGTDGAGFNVVRPFAGFPTDGQQPYGSLIQSGATLYGMTPGGGSAGAGTVFQIRTDGTNYGLLHQFANNAVEGHSPYGSLVRSGSIVYGATRAGGAANLGTVFKMNIDGRGLSVLYSFAGGPGDGQHPQYATLVLSGSTLYGTTLGGGSALAGTIFKINTDGTGYAVLHSFTGGPNDGQTPFGSLTLSGSSLFGMTNQGGTTGNGTLFKINTDGTGFGVVHSFAGGPADGAGPRGDLTLSGSTLFGMTTTGGADALGTIFGIGTDGGGYGVLHSFAGGPGDGANPEGSLILAGSTVFGMTAIGGSSNLGVVFSFPVAVPEPSSLLLVGAAGSLAFLRRR